MFGIVLCHNHGEDNNFNPTIYCLFQSQTCLGDLSQCLYGLSTSGWYNFKELRDRTYYLDSGNKGMKLYYENSQLVGEFQQGNQNWKVKMNNPQRGR